ncbi:MAG TPA: dynamin family protein [Candidatus Ozemobacteraceae bacterium]|nr:dynamin family protein [Candidatus Ozemobacteraceae bacterium]
MTLARAVSRLAKAYPGIEPDAYEITLWGRISIEDGGDGDGALVVHPRGVALCRPSALLDEGFDLNLAYDDVALFSCAPARFEFRAAHEGRVETIAFVPSPETQPGYVAEAASRIRLRMLGIVARGAAWPAVLLPDCGMERAAEAARVMEELARVFPGHPAIVCRQAALMNAAGNPAEAIDLLAASGRARGENEQLMMIVSMICAGRTRQAEILLNEMNADIAGLTQACARLGLVCRLQRPGRAGAWPGWLEQLFIAPLLRDGCIRPEWPAVRKALLSPGVQTLELVAALFDDDRETAVNLLDPARRETWFDPLISMLAEAACFALDGDFGTAFLRLWPARGRVAAMPLMCLASASGNERKLLEWLESADSADFDLAPDERGVLAHLLWRAGKHGKAAALLEGITPEERTVMHPDVLRRLAIIESHLDGKPSREHPENCLEPLMDSDDGACHPEASRFAAELRLILAEKEAAVEHHRDARAELIRASTLIEDTPTDPLRLRLDELRNKIPAALSNLRWAGISAVVGKSLQIVPEERRTALAEAWNSIVATAGNPLTIAFMGEFNAGKSSIVNALLQRPLLPTGVLPTTRIPCAIEYADIESLIGVREGGIVTPRPLQDLRALLAESHGGTDVRLSGFERMLLFVRLSTITHLRILDLPGLNARLVRHQTCSETAIAEADIVVWIDNATQFAAASNAASRTRLAKPWQSLILVLNRVDEIEPAERSDVISGWLQHLGDTNDHRLFITACPPDPSCIEGIREFSVWLSAMNASAPQMIAGYRKRRLLEFLKRLQEEVEASHLLAGQELQEEPPQPPQPFRIGDAAVRDLVGRLQRRIDEWKRLGMPTSALPETVESLAGETLKIDLAGSLALVRLTGEIVSGAMPDFRLVRSVCDGIARETSALRRRSFARERARRRQALAIARSELAVRRMLFSTPLLETIRGLTDDRIDDLPWMNKKV